MHYGLSSNSFSQIFSQAKAGDRSARLFLRLACFTTFSALNTTSSRTGQFVLSSEQLELLASDSTFGSFIEGLHIDYTSFSKIEIMEVDASTPDTGSIKLPERSVSQNTLFTTPTWLGDLGSGYYGPSIRFGDLIAAWRGENLPLSQLTGIVSLIDPENGKGLLNESHIINGIGLKGSANADEPTHPGSRVSLIRFDDWFSLAQFGSVLATQPSEEAEERLIQALIKNDFSAYEDEQAYLFMADVTMNENSVIRREFSAATYQEMPDTPFTMAKDSKQYLETIPKGTSLTVIGKIHLKAESGFGGKLDTNIHIHGLSPKLLAIILAVSSEQLYDDEEEFSKVDAILADLSESEQIYCGHLKTETGQCFFKSIEKIHAIQSLSNVIEVNKTGVQAHNVLTGQPVERLSMAKLIMTNSATWSKERPTSQCSTATLDSVVSDSFSLN